MVTIGLEQGVQSPPALLRGARFGLLMNQASLDRQFHYACDVLAERFPGQLVAIFSPQHGLWSEQQANMIESPHGWHSRLGLPVYSLYSEHRRPTPEMLQGLDVLVVDLQDVGTRVYTFIWTISHCLEACAAEGIPMMVLDRPNPLGGVAAEGPLLDLAYASFVGRAAMPMRHALTLGELARLVNERVCSKELQCLASASTARNVTIKTPEHIQGTEVPYYEQSGGRIPTRADLHIVPMHGWRRDMPFADTGRTWVAPSPNLPRIEGVQLYPGGVLLEGTNLSEGRGTTTPFEVVGAPFIDSDRLVAELSSCDLPGVVLRPIRFVPTFDKWRGQSCGGLYLHVVDPVQLRPYRLFVTLIATIARLWPDDFHWLPPPYEYETEKMPIDILSGSSALRERIDRREVIAADELEQLTAAPPSWKADLAEWSLYA